jgi:tight adherence protein C
MDMPDIAGGLTDPTFIASVLAAVAAFAAIMTVASPMLGDRRLEARLKSVTTRREELRRRHRASLEQKGLRREAKGFMKDTVDKLNLQKLLEDDTLEGKLLQAGLRGPGPTATFYFFRFSLPFAFAAIAIAWLLVVKPAGLTDMQRLATVVGAIAFGYYLPTIWLSNVIQKRRDSIVKAFPDALDMMLICVESGMSIELAFQRVGQEIGTASIELAEELSLTTAELNYLPDRRQAYENLAKRTNHPGVKGVATALIQAERYGTPLGSALRVMAKENRELRIMAAEKKAAALPAQLTVPMILFFLPVLFMVILGPAAIRIGRTPGVFG